MLLVSSWVHYPEHNSILNAIRHKNRNHTKSEDFSKSPSRPMTHMNYGCMGDHITPLIEGSGFYSRGLYKGLCRDTRS